MGLRSTTHEFRISKREGYRLPLIEIAPIRSFGGESVCAKRKSGEVVFLEVAVIIEWC